MNPDFAEMLAELSAAGADFMIVGAHAVAAYSRPRATGDIDIWVGATPDNAERVWNALVAFGAPLDAISVDDLSAGDLVFQIGIAPSRIDILTSIQGVSFEDAWPRRNKVMIGALSVPLISREDLVRNKRAVGRLKDLADLEELGR